MLSKALNCILPNNVIWRKSKLGFNAPEKTWLSHHESEMLKKISNSILLNELTDMPKLMKQFPVMSLNNKWKYFNVAALERVYKVK